MLTGKNWRCPEKRLKKKMYVSSLCRPVSLCKASTSEYCGNHRGGWKTYQA